MLNRRSLRIKGMQALYAFNQCKLSDYQLALDFISEKFVPSFNDTEVIEPEKLNAWKNEATEIFKKYAPANVEIADPDSPSYNAAQEAVVFYKNQINKDYNFLLNNLINNIEKLEIVYYSLLKLVIEFKNLAETDESEQKVNANLSLKFISRGNFIGNKLINKLKNNNRLNQLIAVNKISWENATEKVNEWYHEILKKDQTFIDYISLKNPDFNEDKTIVNHIFKNIVFKNPVVESHFEETIQNWVEDKSILKSMTVKTINSIEEEGEDIAFLTLTENWEDDRDFFTLLFKNTIQNSDEYEKYIIDKTKNWDIERIAFTDKIILKMAICEMINFPSIPVKVTINEYLEISKIYSTPKSKKFINGLLDVISSELKDKGILRKSGRGLIDNK